MAVASNSGSGGNRGRKSLAPSAAELSAMLDSRVAVDYRITDSEIKGMAKMLAPGVNPFTSLPVAAQNESFEAIAIFNDDDDYEDLTAEETAGQYYQPETYQNNADEDLDNYDAPAPLSIIPTSTMNYRRPRTVAAGYAPNRDGKGLGVLTVVFRDGLFYNYHDVSTSEWNGFKSAYSKGRYILAHLDSHARGAANMGSMPTYARETLYRIARTNQIFYEYGYKTTKSGAIARGQKQKQGIIPTGKASQQPKSALKSNKGNKKKR